jgi:hypothetical protein
MTAPQEDVLRVELSLDDIPLALHGEQNATFTYTRGTSPDRGACSVTVRVSGLGSRKHAELLAERFEDDVRILLRGSEDGEPCEGTPRYPPVTADSVKKMMRVELAHLPGSRDGGYCFRSMASQVR